MNILGIDCSTNDKSVAIAPGRLENGVLVVEAPVVCGGATGKAVDVVLQHLRERAHTLLAIDAPLGWPIDLGPALACHRAGVAIPVESNKLFRRATDREIKKRINQQPLDVGADRIARTAHWALALLGELRSATGSTIPLIWRPEMVSGLGAIEVYPAATLKALGILPVGYKKKEQIQNRRTILSKLSGAVTFSADADCFTICADALDAAVCALAGADFLRGNCLGPSDADLAAREGWIWVRTPAGART